MPQFVANGTLFALPAGDVSTTLRLGGDVIDFNTRSTRSGAVPVGAICRGGSVNGQANFDLPITSLRNDVLSAIGDLSANFNAAADRLSDFGTLTTIGYGLTWKPRDGVSLHLVAHRRRGRAERSSNSATRRSPPRRSACSIICAARRWTSPASTAAIRPCSANDRHVTKLGLDAEAVREDAICG